jgi:dynein heavy chain 1
MNSASMMSKIKGLPEVSGRIIWLNQFKRKALVYKDKIAIVLGDNWETLAEGKRVKEIIDSIVKTSGQISRITDDWTREVIGLNIDSYSTEKIINIVNKQNNYELRVNFDEKLIDLFKEVRLIHGNFGNVSQLIISRSMENKGNYPFAIALQDAFKTFNNSCQKIKNEQKIAKLIAKQKKDIQDLIQANISTTWSNYPKLDRFTKEICEKVSSFEESVRDLTSKMSQIESLFSQIQKAELNQEFISEKIKSVQRIIDEISDCSNMQIWIKEMDQKLESILIQKLKETIDIWLKEFLAPKPLKEPILLQDVSIHKIKITDQLIYLEPSIYEAREFWYNQFHQALSIVLSNRRLEYRIEAQYNKESQFKESTYREIIKLIDQNILQNCYKKLENVFDECEEYVKTWLSYQVICYIQQNNIYNKLLYYIDKCKKLIN